MAAVGVTEPRCASERGLAMGGGRPAERRFTVGGSGKSVARCHRTVLAYWKFESISLQRGVTCEPDDLFEIIDSRPTRTQRDSADIRLTLTPYALPCAARSDWAAAPRHIRFGRHTDASAHVPRRTVPRPKVLRRAAPASGPVRPGV